VCRSLYLYLEADGNPCMSPALPPTQFGSRTALHRKTPDYSWRTPIASPFRRIAGALTDFGLRELYSRSYLLDAHRRKIDVTTNTAGALGAIWPSVAPFLWRLLASCTLATLGRRRGMPIAERPCYRALYEELRFCSSSCLRMRRNTSLCSPSSSWFWL